MYGSSPPPGSSLSPHVLLIEFAAAICYSLGFALAMLVICKVLGLLMLSNVKMSNVYKSWIPLDKDTLDPQSSNKLNVYRSVKSQFTCEYYLKFLRNPDLRSAATKLRISSHSLPILGLY